jgi:hypothetical protein
MFVDAGDDAACYHEDRLISMTCASNATLLLNFESSGSGSTAAWSHGHDIITLTITADAERAIMERIILEMRNEKFIVVADDVEKAATGTITITDYTELNSPDKINLVATDGTNYDFVQGDQSSVSGTFEATTSNNVTATNLMNVINTSSGPSGSRFTATVADAVVTATQATVGADGNTTVTLTDSGTAGMSKENFSGGKDKEYLDSRITACTIALDT